MNIIHQQLPAYIIVGWFIFWGSLDTVSEEAEDSTDPQQHGETTKQLETRENNIQVSKLCRSYRLQQIWGNLHFYNLNMQSSFVFCMELLHQKLNFRSVEATFFTCLQNLTHSGVVGGGVRAFGPSRARTSFALELERPWKETQGTGLASIEKKETV